MEIKITEKHSEEFFREVMNVVTHIKRVQKKPDAEINDYVMEYKNSTYLALVAALILLVVQLVRGFDIISIIAVILLAISGLYYRMALKKLKLIETELINNDKESTFLINEEGISLTKDDEKSIILWENLSVIKVLKETISFVPKSNGSKLIAIDKKYLDEVAVYFDNNKRDVKIVK